MDDSQLTNLPSWEVSGSPENHEHTLFISPQGDYVYINQIAPKPPKFENNGACGCQYSGTLQEVVQNGKTVLMSTAFDGGHFFISPVHTPIATPPTIVTNRLSRQR